MAGTKSIAIGCIALVVVGGIIIAAVVGGIFMLGLKDYADNAENEGVEFGRRTDQQGCQDEAFRRLKQGRRAANPISSRASELFLYGCFQTSSATPGFCRDAPDEDSFLAVRKWAQDRCDRQGAGSDDICISLLMEKSNACLGKINRIP